MNRTPLFIGLTKPPTFVGLPMTYVVILIMIVGGGFLATLSFIYFVLSGIIGYAILRGAAAYDERLMDVALTVIQATPLKGSQIAGKGVKYRA